MLTYRLVKGSPLTIEELDENFKTLETSIENLQVQMAPIELKAFQDGDVLIFKNNTEDIGHIVLPKFEPNFKGKWQALVNYQTGDWVFFEKKLYACIKSHAANEKIDEQNWILIFDGEQ